MKKQLTHHRSSTCASVPLIGSSSGGELTQCRPSHDPVFERDSQRESLGGGYSGKREYVLENHNFNKRAEMQVSVDCDADGTKHFDVLAEDGWKSANKHVLRKMLESESETSLPNTRPMTRLVPANYEFRLSGSEYVQGQARLCHRGCSPAQRQVSVSRTRMGRCRGFCSRPR